MSDHGWSREATPEDAAIVADLIGQVLEGLEPPDSAVFRMCLEGYSRTGIAKELRLTEGSVRVRIDRMKARLERLLKKGD